MTVKVSVKRSLADRLWLLVMVVEPGAAAGVDREAAVRAGGIAGEAQHRVVVDVAGADRPRRGQGTVLGGGAALEPPTDHRRVIGAGDRDGDVLGGGRPDRPVTVTVKVSVKRSLADRLWLLVMV